MDWTALGNGRWEYGVLFHGLRQSIRVGMGYLLEYVVLIVFFANGSFDQSLAS
jgi:type III secretory pathway component EscT